MLSMVVWAGLRRGFISRQTGVNQGRLNELPQEFQEFMRMNIFIHCVAQFI